MPYALPKELAERFSISGKTVYNYLKKYPDKIRSKKEFGKTFVHLEDFTKVLQAASHYHQISSSLEPKTQRITGNWKRSEEVSNVQNDYKIILWENENLQKQKDNLEHQIVKYVELHKEEKAEKKEILDKYDKLQNQFKDHIEKSNSQRIGMVKRYYTLLILCAVCIVILIIVVAPNMVEWLWHGF